MGSEDTVIALYVQIFDRQPDSAGLTYYVGQLDDGLMTAVTIAQNIFDGPIGNDALSIANKLIVANLFTAAIDTDEEDSLYAGNVAAVEARAFLSTIDADTVIADVDAAVAVALALASIVSAAALDILSSLVRIGILNPDVLGDSAASTFTLTAGIDTLTGSRCK